MRRALWVMAAVVMGLASLAATTASAREPIIDMHLHASEADEQGPPPLALCGPIFPMPVWDQQTSWPEALMRFFKNPTCQKPIWSPMTGEEIMRKSLAIMERRNIIGVVNDRQKAVAAWRKAAPERVLAGLSPAFSEMSDDKAMTAAFSAAKKAGDIAVIGEIGTQYVGIAPDSPKLEPLWTAAETADLPVSLHVGPGPPGTPYLPGMGYRARMSSPLLLEDVLVRHPKLRLNLMHAGYPMLDDTLALLYAHPQVYLDTGVIAFTQPRESFYRYLKALVDAGFGNRIMFGSDQMVWPEAIEQSIEAIEQAPFLSQAQKRDILYNNAARFLRLDAATIKRHSEM